ncbi:MAG TPA: VanZ family protein, partial [Gemmatimonadales bacterium]|nr:VanZ family protein [Gemmatimonadales bacterium]
EGRPDSARSSIAALLWALAAGVLLLVPSGALPGVWVPGILERVADKAGHAALFLVGALAVHRALRARPRVRGPLAWAAAAVILYGGGLEVAQALTGRDPSAADWLADAVGAGIYAGFILSAK